MEEIKVLENKYRFVTVESDIATPYKYMPQTIRELSDDLKEIDKIISKSNDSEVKKLCERLKSKLNIKKKFFENKLENIPNKYYMEESDEEWVDANKPNWSFEVEGKL